jgi:hypothetical protein
MKYKKAKTKTITTVLPSGRTKTQEFNLNDPLDQPMLLTLNPDKINKMWSSLDAESKRILLHLIKDTDLTGTPPNLS